MRMRFCQVGLLVCSLSCQSVPPAHIADEQTEAARLWHEGQVRLQQGHAKQALERFEESLALDPELHRNHLSMAAASLEKGDEIGACIHLGCYVDEHPEHWVVRGQYAELLLRLHRVQAARDQFELFGAKAQEAGEEAIPQLVHCHSRLTRIARTQHDYFGEHLHRGIGLYYLACERAKLPDANGELPVEALLFQAAGELALARTLKPNEARPSWFLYQAWTTLSVRHAALQSLRRAYEDAPFSFLTQHEFNSLQLAWMREMRR
ncbi:MAG: hypothetical protein KatS3mg105_1897 [Gemmatales bacterium]|nr:MAG: hypothetical protein KatS3mg105_1897 [Gemmatales bacterium]